MTPRATFHGGPAGRAENELMAWRRSRLLAAGFAPEVASDLTRDSAVDLHELLELVDRGCPPHLAARILAPLDYDGTPQ
jgi:hypothetical protein